VSTSPGSRTAGGRGGGRRPLPGGGIQVASRRVLTVVPVCFSDGARMTAATPAAKAAAREARAPVTTSDDATYGSGPATTPTDPARVQRAASSPRSGSVDQDRLRDEGPGAG
jgi:hypothetical protein